MVGTIFNLLINNQLTTRYLLLSHKWAGIQCLYLLYLNLSIFRPNIYCLSENCCDSFYRNICACCCIVYSFIKITENYMISGNGLCHIKYNKKQFSENLVQSDLKKWSTRDEKQSYEYCEGSMQSVRFNDLLLRKPVYYKGYCHRLRLQS